MSAITKIWTPVLIKKVIRCLDEKTGLNVADWTIKMNNETTRLGYCNYENKILAFSNHYLNDPEFRESEAYDLIRHEYAHAYAYLANLDQWIHYDRKARHHGAHWKYACRMLGTSGRRAYSTEKLTPEIDRMTATKIFFAEDVEKIDVKKHLETWHCIPMLSKEKEDLNDALKRKCKKNRFFEPGDECFRIKKGHGVVWDTYPDCLKNRQMVQVQYESGEIEIANSVLLIKKVGGVLVI